MKTFAQFIKETSDRNSMTVAPSSTEKAMTTRFTAEEQEPERETVDPEINLFRYPERSTTRVAG
jgi:hypothetical protein